MSSVPFAMYPFAMYPAAAAPNKPAELMSLLNNLMTAATWRNAEQVRLLLDRNLDLELLVADWISRFVMDSEWNWFAGTPPVDDC